MTEPLYPKTTGEKNRLARRLAATSPWCANCRPYAGHIGMALRGAPMRVWRRRLGLSDGTL
jgi:hypothetical protein